MAKSTLLKSMIFTAVLSTSMTAGHASTLLIKNDDTAKVEVVIQPGEGTTFASSPEVRRTIDPGKEEKIVISSADLSGASTFSVKGIGTMPTLVGNVCHELFVNRDYQITFSGKTLGGVSCHHQPLPKSEKEKDSKK